MALAAARVVEPQRTTARDVQREFEHYRRHGDRSERAALIERHLPLARYLARRYGTVQEREDLEQVASLALVKAVDRFDPARGIAFSTFAVPTILGELKRYFRDLGWTVRVPRHLQELARDVNAATAALTAELGHSPTPEQLAARCKVRPDEVLEALQTTTAHFPDSLDNAVRDSENVSLQQAVGRLDPELERAEQAVDIDRLLAGLPRQDAAVVRLRFRDDLVQKEIAQRLGVSQMQVSRICARAIAQLADDALGATAA